MAVKWLGNRKCDACGGEIQGTLYDAKSAQGPWGTFCETHFLLYAGCLGTGLGQKYAEQPDGDFIKVEG